MNKLGNLKSLFYLPSFYGFVTLSLTYIIYNLQVIEFGFLSIITHFVIFSAILSFLISTIVFYALYNSTLLSIEFPSFSVKKWVLLFFYSVSFFGVYLYVREFVSFYGSLSAYVLIFFSDNSSQLRAYSEIASDTIGVQLTYFGWIALGLNTFYFLKSRISKFWYVPYFLTFVSNFLFIDRTRPIWIILIISFIAFFVKANELAINQLLKRVTLLAFAFILLFISIGALAGKTTDEKLYNGWDISPNSQNVIFYLTSSFFYLDYLILNKDPDYRLDRTIYPFLKSMNIFGFSDRKPTSLVNEFLGYPYQTNVGTFLEPFYSDFGLFYVLVGILVHAFLLNALAIFFLRMRSPYSIFVASNICVVNFFVFFTPKINNFPIWLFLFLGLLSVLRNFFSKLFYVKEEDSLLY